MKSETPSVACIIPYYNGSAFIERALSSALTQTRALDEIIVVNDGSITEEADFLHALARRYPIKLIDKENGGQGSARNRGVVESQSEYICFLDQDDFFTENHVELLLGAVPQKDLRFGYVYADLHEADVDGNLIRFSILETLSRRPRRTIFDYMRSDLFILPSASLISRQAFSEIGGFDEQFTGYEDDDLFLRFFRKRYNSYFVDAPVTVWCIHATSTSYSKKMNRSRFLYFKKLAAEFPDERAEGRFYFRECLMPRFGNQFVNDVVHAARTGSPDLQEFREMMAYYLSIARENRNLRFHHRAKLWVSELLFIKCPPSTIRFLRQIGMLSIVRKSVRIGDPRQVRKP